MTAFCLDVSVVLYQTDWCPYCVRVRQALDELAVPYEVVNVPDDHAQRTLLRQLFGETGVPSIVDGDVKIADDDDAIIEYLQEKYPKRR